MCSSDLFLICVFVGWIIKPETLIEEVKVSSAFKLEKAWVIMIKYVAPVLHYGRFWRH